MIKLIALSLLLNASYIFACNGFLPFNKLFIPTTDQLGGLSQLEYDVTIDKVQDVYAPIVSASGGSLIIKREWLNGTVNAGTNRSGGGKQWNLNLYGGLARHRFMTKDAYALVICHEIGHHLGGAPKKTRDDSPAWSSTEGQADYWATLKCLRRIFQNEDNESIIREVVIPPLVVQECEKKNPKKKETALCIRLALASKALSQISAVVRRTDDPQFETPDSSIVDQVYEMHPLPQCRLDSFFQGALCSESFEENVSQEDELQGTCHPVKGHKLGIRPECWYHSKP